MPAIHEDAICLRHREWSETSQTVTLLTRAHGLVHGLAKGSLRDKAPYSGGFEHLQFGELGFIHKPDKDLAILTDWDLREPFHAFRADYRSAVVAMFAAEIASLMLAPLDAHPATFDALLGLLCALATGADEHARMRHLAVYLDALLTDTGHMVDLDVVVTGEGGGRSLVWAYDPDAGTFHADPDRRLPSGDPFEPVDRAGGVWHVREDTVLLLRSLRDGFPSESPVQQVEGEASDRTGWMRAARFLTACAGYRASRRPVSLDSFLRLTRN